MADCSSNVQCLDLDDSDIKVRKSSIAQDHQTVIDNTDTSKQFQATSLQNVVGSEDVIESTNERSPVTSTSFGIDAELVPSHKSESQDISSLNDLHNVEITQMDREHDIYPTTLPMSTQIVPSMVVNEVLSLKSAQETLLDNLPRLDKISYVDANQSLIMSSDSPPLLPITPATLDVHLEPADPGQLVVHSSPAVKEELPAQASCADTVKSHDVIRSDDNQLKQSVTTNLGVNVTPPSPIATATTFCQLTLASDLIHHIKWISWNGAKTPIVTQNENGPCPLLAIINVLLLRGQVRLPDAIEVITTQNLLDRLGDCILRLIPPDMAQRPDYQQNVCDALSLLPKLSTGLDVNVRFTGISEFEYTPECIVFDLLNIGLYHGWLVSPTSASSRVVGTSSYNQLVERIIDSKCSENSSIQHQALIAEEFLEYTASQLTDCGLRKLNEGMKNGELAVFFRNNHFSTIFRHEKGLLLLVTDQGFLNEHDVIWETLDDVYGNCRFVSSDFKVVPPKSSSSVPKIDLDYETERILHERQVESDHLFAISLSQQETSSMTPCNEEDDFQMARRLQEEENRQAQLNRVSCPTRASPTLIPDQPLSFPADAACSTSREPARMEIASDVYDHGLQSPLQSNPSMVRQSQPPRLESVGRGHSQLTPSDDHRPGPSPSHRKDKCSLI